MGLGFVSKILGGSVGHAAKGIAEAIDTFVETAEEKKAAEALLLKIQQKPDQWQAAINRIEAGHRSMFVAGWRPAIGWVCVLALAWGWVARPCAIFTVNLLQAKGLIGTIPELPGIEVGEAISLAMAMLGLAGIRSYEKKHGLTG